MFYRISFLSILLICTLYQLKAQTSETIVTGRPGQSSVPFTVGKGVLQLQQGVDYSSDTYSSVSFPNGVHPYYGFVVGSSGKLKIRKWTTTNFIRYGIRENLEISGSFNYIFDQEQDPVSALSIGARFNITDGMDGGPAWGVQTHLGFSEWMNQEDLKQQGYPSVLFLSSLSQDLWEGHALTLNLGGKMSEYSSGEITYTFAYSLALGRKWSVFIENYGTYFTGDTYPDAYSFITYFDTGASYLLNNNVQFDVQGGYGVNKSYLFRGEDVKSFFAGAGISWRVFTL